MRAGKLDIGVRKTVKVRQKIYDRMRNPLSENVPLFARACGTHVSVFPVFHALFDVK